MEKVLDELKIASNMFKETIKEQGWTNSADGMKNIWYTGARFGANVIVRNMLAMDIQKLRNTQSDAEFRRKLNEMIGY